MAGDIELRRIPRDGPQGDASMPRFEAYRSGVETVIFDAENPLAWIASAHALPLDGQT